MSTKYAFDIMIELVEIVDMKFVSSPPNVRAQRPETGAGLQHYIHEFDFTVSD